MYIFILVVLMFVPISYDLYNYVIIIRSNINVYNYNVSIDNNDDIIPDLININN
jgi:hypothetical protein